MVSVDEDDFFFFLDFDAGSSVFASGSGSASSVGFMTALEGAWNSRSDRRTLYICSASSLHPKSVYQSCLFAASADTHLVGEMTIAPT